MLFFSYDCFDAARRYRQCLLVSSNVSSECCVVSVAEAGQDGRQEFVVLEPDDEKYFSMVDNGKLFYF
jgi:hypothetical protein